MEFARIRTALRGRELHRRLDQLDAVAVSPAAAGSEEELRLAAHLAGKALAGGKNIAKAERYEFLLWLAGKRDIRSAMEATSPQRGERDIVVVWFSRTSEEEVLRRLEAEDLSIGLPEEGEPLRIERISLSRLRG